MNRHYTTTPLDCLLADLRCLGHSDVDLALVAFKSNEYQYFEAMADAANRPFEMLHEMLDKAIAAHVPTEVEF